MLFSPEEWAELVATMELSPQQARLLAAIIDGRSDKQIVKEMNIAYSTVRTHMERLFRRFNVEDRTALAVKAFSEFHAACARLNCPRNCRRRIHRQ